MLLFATNDGQGGVVTTLNDKGQPLVTLGRGAYGEGLVTTFRRALLPLRAIELVTTVRLT